MPALLSSVNVAIRRQLWLTRMVPASEFDYDPGRITVLSGAQTNPRSLVAFTHLPGCRLLVGRARR